eukprot:SAG11_NODE_13104_length_670_cov_0.774081_2_plen_73_part_01
MAGYDRQGHDQSRTLPRQSKAPHSNPRRAAGVYGCASGDCLETTLAWALMCLVSDRTQNKKNPVKVYAMRKTT